jgi:hypothetical protein
MKFVHLANHINEPMRFRDMNFFVFAFIIFLLTDDLEAQIDATEFIGAPYPTVVSIYAPKKVNL